MLLGFMFFVYWFFFFIWFDLVGGRGEGGRRREGGKAKKVKIGPSTHFLHEELKQLVVKAWLIAEKEALGLCFKYLI